jgi:hypothetical protein
MIPTSDWIPKKTSGFKFGECILSVGFFDFLVYK